MSQVDARYLGLLRTVDPAVLGSWVRSGRVAKGWTQAELAGAACSVAYLSRIETGARRPTLRILTYLADRLGLSVEAMLRGASAADRDEVRLGLSYAELALQNGEPVDAERQARHYLARAEEASMVDLVTDGRFLVARASEALGQLEDASRELEALLADSTGLAAARCAVALSRCYRELGDLGLAIEIGERVRTALAADGLERTDEAIQLSMTVALAYIERGDLAHAARICRDAIEIAEQEASLSARSAAYWNASIVQSERGDVQSALELATRALALLAEGQDARNLARLRLELGRLQLELEPPDLGAALEQIERGNRDLRATSASTAEIAHGELVLARALLLGGRPQEAADAAEAARSTNPEDGSLGAAEALLLLGEARAELGARDEALAAYGEAALLLSQLVATDRWFAQAWCELAELYEALGELDAARAALRGAASASGLRLRSRRPDHTRLRRD